MPIAVDILRMLMEKGTLCSVNAQNLYQKGRLKCSMADQYWFHIIGTLQSRHFIALNMEQKTWLTLKWLVHELHS